MGARYDLSTDLDDPYGPFNSSLCITVLLGDIDRKEHEKGEDNPACQALLEV